jgi:biopolymer transport protein ExbB/TolQ
MHASDYLADILHLVSQALLVPTMLVLAFFILSSLWSIGAVAVEYFTERRRLTAKVPELADILNASQVTDFAHVIENSGLLRRQKAALLELIKHRHLPEDSVIAVARRLLAAEEEQYSRVVARTDTVAKIAPMLGLMGTLIPLGPGLVGLGTGNVNTLAKSLLIAFDATVAGLCAAAIGYVISKLRRRWYEGYVASLDALTTCVLEKMIAERQKVHS